MLTKLLKSLFIIVCSLIAVTHFAFAGDSRGGGDALTEGPASPDDIRSTIEGLNGPLTSYFNKLEFGAKVMDQIQDFPNKDLVVTIYRKLFNNKPTVFDQLKIVKFVVKEHGPCKDLDGKDVDASAFNTAPDEICFSLERLSQKVGRISMTLQITTLGVHEASHRVGTTEPEAEILQNMAIEMLSNKVNKDLPDVKKDFGLKLGNLQSALTAVQFSLDTKSGMLDTCGNISTVLGATSNLLDTYFQVSNHYGVTPISSEAAASLWSLSLKNMTAQFYCQQEGDPKKVVFSTFFSGKSQVSLREYLKKLTASSTVDPKDGGSMIELDPGEGTLTYVKYEDATTLRAVIADIRETVSRIQKDLGVIPTAAHPAYPKKDFTKEMAVIKAAQNRLEEETASSSISPKEINCQSFKISRGQSSLYLVEMSPGESYAVNLENMNCHVSTKNTLLIKCEEQSARKYPNTLEVYPMSWAKMSENQPVLLGSAARAIVHSDDGTPRMTSIVFTPETCKIIP